MALLRFFRIPKPKKFEYKPLYYDPQKEAIEERKRRISSELTGEPLTEEEYSNRIKGSMRSTNGRIKPKNLKTDARTSNIRIIVIIVVLLFLAWYFILR